MSVNNTKSAEMIGTNFQFLPYGATDIEEPAVLPYQKEINELAETKDACLEKLRNDLRNLKEFEPFVEDKHLLIFLRVAKFNTSKAFQRIKNYHKKIDLFAETYKNFSFPLQKAKSLGHIWASPYRCENNSYLILANFGIDYRKFTFEERFFLEVMFFHELTKNPINQICGGTYVFDFEGFDLYGFLAFTPGWLKLCLDFLVNVFPCRLKAVHLINVPSIFYPIWKVAYPFLSKKIQSRFFLHTKKEGYQNLLASISPDILPEKYGGKLKDDELIDCLENLEEFDYLKTSLTFGDNKTKKCRQAVKFF